VNVITSARNPAVTAARKLARAHGRARHRSGGFLLEGAQGLQAAMDAGARPVTVFATPEAAARHQALLAAARTAGAELRVVAAPLLAELVFTSG
jgi:TrmH family RNA methyltransferase